MKELNLFAYLAETLGETITVQLPDVFDKEQLLQAVAASQPLMKSEIMTCNVAVDQAFATESETFVREQVGEIALIPPVSGG